MVINTSYVKKFGASRVRATFFSEHVVNVWNLLPSSVDFGSLAGFKHSIEKVDFTKFLRYDKCHKIQKNGQQDLTIQIRGILSSKCLIWPITVQNFMTTDIPQIQLHNRDPKI